jgi:hypothetical protein
VRRYTVRLEVRADRPPTREEIEALEGGRHGVITVGRPRSRRLEVHLTMRGVDVVGVLARAVHHVLDRLPGEVVAAEVAASVRSVPRS